MTRGDTVRGGGCVEKSPCRNITPSVIVDNTNIYLCLIDARFACPFCFDSPEVQQMSIITKLLRHSACPFSFRSFVPVLAHPLIALPFSSADHGRHKSERRRAPTVRLRPLAWVRRLRIDARLDARRDRQPDRRPKLQHAVEARADLPRYRERRQAASRGRSRRWCTGARRARARS